MKTSLNQRIGMLASLINIVAVLGFGLAMLFNLSFLCYLTSAFIALSFVMLHCAYAHYATPERRLAGKTGAVFAGMYATVILLVYFAQMTTVRLEPLNEQAAALLDFQRFGLLFNYDMLGYSLMALATVFAGLSIRAQTKADKWLKGLLLGHGVFFLSCFVMPILGVFTNAGASESNVSVIALLFWCAYFIPIGILSYKHFKNKPADA